jgi:hypothetical protein
VSCERGDRFDPTKIAKIRIGGITPHWDQNTESSLFVVVVVVENAQKVKRVE